MDLEMVLNELSLETESAASVQIARQQMTDFLGTVRVAIKLGVKGILRTSTDLNYVSLAPGYLLSQWRNDNEVDRETRQFFRSLGYKSSISERCNR